MEICSVVECLLSTCKSLDSIPGTKRKRRQEEEEEEAGGGSESSVDTGICCQV